MRASTYQWPPRVGAAPAAQWTPGRHPHSPGQSALHSVSHGASAASIGWRTGAPVARERSPGGTFETTLQSGQGPTSTSGTLTTVLSSSDLMQRSTLQRAASGALSRVDSGSSWVPILSQHDGDPRRRGRTPGPAFEAQQNVERMSNVAGPQSPQNRSQIDSLTRSVGAHQRHQQQFLAKQRGSLPSEISLTPLKKNSGLSDTNSRDLTDIEVAFDRRVEEAKVTARSMSGAASLGRVQSTQLEGKIEHLQQVFRSLAEEHYCLQQQYKSIVDIEEKRTSTSQQAKFSEDLSEETAARKLQGAALIWLGRRRRHIKREEGSTRDRWRRVIQDVEVAVNRALSRAGSVQDLTRTPRQTRLQLLANVLKQGVLKINQAMMQQMLQDLKGPSSGRGEPSDAASGFDNSSNVSSTRVSSRSGA